MEVITRTYYRVAEHLFAVESSNTVLLQCMTNYEPFREPTPNPNIKERELDEDIFTLRVEGERLEVRGREWTHVFTDNAEADMPRIEVYRSSLEDASLQFRGGEWLFRVAMVANAPICCELECNENFTEGVLHIAADCQDVRFCIDNALMLLFAFRTAPLMTLEMHAAVVVRGDGRGYLFLGHSGTGKSTHARQWLQAFPDAWLLNDDNPILRVMEDGEVRVYGSPWSGKTPCYKNAYARVGGIIKLSQAPHNQIRKLSLPEAYAYILSSASGLKIERQMTDNMYNTIRDIITQVGCYHMECLPNTEAAEVCFSGCRV